MQSFASSNFSIKLSVNHSVLSAAILSTTLQDQVEHSIRRMYLQTITFKLRPTYLASYFHLRPVWVKFREQGHMSEKNVAKVVNRK